MFNDYNISIIFCILHTYMKRILSKRNPIKFNVSNSSRIFYDEIKKSDCNLLDKEEELLIIKKIKSNKNNSTHINKLVKAHLRLVTRLASYYKDKYYGTLHLELSDLIQEGNIGLMNAIQKVISKEYSPSKGRFSSYSFHKIRASITYYIYNLRKDKDISFEEYDDNSTYVDTEEDFISMEEIYQLIDSNNLLTERENSILKMYYGIPPSESNYSKYRESDFSIFPMISDDISYHYNLTSASVLNIINTAKKKLKPIFEDYLNIIL